LKGEAEAEADVEGWAKRGFLKDPGSLGKFGSGKQSKQ
jgi:hypothetical protein